MEDRQSNDQRIEQVQGSRAAWTLSDRLCTWFFVAFLGLLVLVSPGLLDPGALRHADGLGMGAFAMFIVAGSGSAFLVALALSVVAVNLPLGFRFCHCFQR